MKKLSVLLVALLITACSTTKPVTPSAEQNNATKPAASAVTPTTTAATTASTSSSNVNAAAENMAANSKMDANNSTDISAELAMLHKESVYFDYNDYVIKPEFRSIVAMQAGNFKKNKGKTLVLEGNADERGSAAYNIALGEKRASSVKTALEALGVSGSKVKIVSYGNSKPKLTCHEEKCWKENRRVDFVFDNK